MISPTKTADHVITDGLPGERRAFTIKATGKAFRTLIDGLYENKIGAVVREIISNGYDSHAAAKIPDFPLSITAPTSIDPTFRVRDYGVSMDHETIMDLYTTIFHSTKEETNDEVGQFGLGSKSPFAYTDTFSVTAFLDGEKRVYVAHISDDDVPQITHVVTEPQGEESNGIEVAIPVKPNDVFRFHEEITKMVLGSDVRPEVDGLGKNVPAPVAEGDGWRVIRNTYHWGQVAIRQGCVIYPVHSKSVPSVSYAYTTIVDVPIGSVDVTASRESLSLTPDTERYVNEVIAATERKIQERVVELNNSFVNRLDAFRKRGENEWLARPVGRAYINLVPDQPAKVEKVPAQMPEVLRTQRKTTTKSTFDNPSRIFVIVDDPAITGVMRRRARIQAFYSQHQFSTIILATRRELPRLVRLLGLEGKQVISVAALPDVPVVRLPSSGSNKGRHTAPKQFPAGKYWLRKSGAKTIDFNAGGVYVRFSDDLFSGRRIGILSDLGFMADDVIYLTDNQAKTLKAPDSQNFLTAIKEAAADYAQKHDTVRRVRDYYKYQAIESAVNDYTLRRLICDRHGLDYYNQIVASMVPRASEELNKLYLGAEPDQPDTTDMFVVNVLDVSYEFDLQEFDWTDKVDNVIEKYAELLKPGNANIEFLLDFYFNNQEESNK